jgi:hypothetical protein
MMLYEGNDFRAPKTVSHRWFREWRGRIRSSPLLLSLEDLLANLFGPEPGNTNIQRPPELAWLPVGYPETAGKTRYYDLPVKHFVALNLSVEEFRGYRGWLWVQDIIKRIQNTCIQDGVRLVIVYAPTKVRVVFPLVADQLDPRLLQEFLAIDMREERLPAVNQMPGVLLERFNSIEQVVDLWCRNEKIHFISLTDSLRSAVVQGEQVYYTYDQHWTPTGQQCAAREIARVCRDLSLVPVNAGDIVTATTENPVSSPEVQ